MSEFVCCYVLSVANKIDNIMNNTPVTSDPSFLDELNQLGDAVDAALNKRAKKWITVRSGLVKPGLELGNSDMMSLLEVLEGDFVVEEEVIYGDTKEVAIIDYRYWWPAPAGMRNKEMAEQVRSRKAVDISRCRKLSDGVYQLPYFVDNVKYCDAMEEKWVVAVGENPEKGIIHASTIPDILKPDAYQRFTNLG